MPLLYVLFDDFRAFHNISAAIAVMSNAELFFDDPVNSFYNLSLCIGYLGKNQLYAKLFDYCKWYVFLLVLCYLSSSLFSGNVECCKFSTIVEVQHFRDSESQHCKPQCIKCRI